MPSSDGKRGKPFRDHRQVVEGIVYRYRTGIAWRDLPAQFGPWQTVWKRHRRFAGDGTWDRILTALLGRRRRGRAEIDWTVSVDSTINRAHQHGTNLPRAEQGTGGTGRITRIWATSRLTTPSAAPAAGCRPRSTNCATARAARWCSCSGRGRAATRRCSRTCCDALRVPRRGPGRPRTRPDAVLGDKAYSSRGNRALLRAPRHHRRHRRTRRPGRAPQTPRRPRAAGHRRSTPRRTRAATSSNARFNVFKQWRGLATRYDKLALTYRGGVVLRAIITWLRELGDTP